MRTKTAVAASLRAYLRDRFPGRRLSVHHMYNSGWDWLWMVPMMLLFIAVLGGVVYAAVRLALEHQHKPPLQR